MVATDLTVERTDHRAVGAQQHHQDELHGSTRPTQRARSTRSSSYDDVAAAGSARTTSTAEPGSTPTCSRARCRRRRFTRLRTTALPTALLTTSPIRAGSSPSPAVPRWTTRVREPDRRPRVAARNESASVSRWSGDSNAAPARTAERPSDGQALAALAAARGEDGATRTGAHAQAETVDLVTTTVVRLVRTLAHEHLFRWVCRPGARRIGAARRLLDDRRSTPDDRPTVRAAIRQGQTDAERRRGQPTGRPSSLWMTGCRWESGRVKFAAPRFPASSRRHPPSDRCDAGHLIAE